jgi:hypothetical protein
MFTFSTLAPEWLEEALAVLRLSFQVQIDGDTRSVKHMIGVLYGLGHLRRMQDVAKRAALFWAVGEWGSISR